ncbi:MAG: carboxymuconolactone decarboxylase family protein [Bacteroidetes bacterium]|nr:carboxymuconolactone decarboxylase family protein [Bacteroidota bacterium]
MKTRLQIRRLEPGAYDAMMAMEKYIDSATIQPALSELIRLRASQINGCAYCIEMHSLAALKLGESQRKLFAITAWKESPLFSDEERVALTMTEEITHISAEGMTESTFQEAKKYFNEHEIAQLIMLISLINVWNRIAISTHMHH